MFRFRRSAVLERSRRRISRVTMSRATLCACAAAFLTQGSPAGAAGAPAAPGTLTPQYLVAEVLARSPDLVAAEAAWKAAQARIGPAGDLDDPKLSYAVAPQTAGDPGGLNQIAGLTQAIPWPGILGLRRHAARALSHSSEDRFRDVRLRLAEMARAQYAEWFYVHRALGINKENQTLLARLQEVARTAYASGQAPEQDVLRAEVEQTRLENEALTLVRRRAVIRARINALLDRDPDAPLPSPGELPGGTPLAPKAALARTALARYPKLRGFDAKIEANRDRIDLARKDRYPNFVLGTGYNQLMATDKRWTVGVTINIPLDRSRRRAELDQAHAELRETQARRADVRARLLSDLAESYASARQARESAELDERRLVPLAAENLEASEGDYRSGSGDFLKLITAERQYLMAELDLARARADYYIQLASLDYQSGGAVLPAPIAIDTREAMP